LIKAGSPQQAGGASDAPIPAAAKSLIAAKAGAG
jgi:hypothetical protein